MSAPTRALPGRTARRVTASGPRPDLMWLLWALPPLELGCGWFTDAIGMWALMPAGLFVVALIAAVTWSTGGQR